jgi:hypothetical protein
MSDLISRRAAIEAACKGADLWDGGCDRERSKSIEEAIKAIPSADVPDTNVGTWIKNDYQRPEDTDNDNYLYTCSVCGHGDVHARTQEVPYCWWCGSLMKGGAE